MIQGAGVRYRESERGKQRKSVQNILSRWPLLQVTGCSCWTLWDSLWNVPQSGLLRRRNGVAFIQWISFPISQSSLYETLTYLHFHIAFVWAVSSLPLWPVWWYQKSVGRKQEIFSAGWRWGAVRFLLRQAGQVYDDLVTTGVAGIRGEAERFEVVHKRCFMQIVKWLITYK